MKRRKVNEGAVELDRLRNDATQQSEYFLSTPEDPYYLPSEGEENIDKARVRPSPKSSKPKSRLGPTTRTTPTKGSVKGLARSQQLSENVEAKKRSPRNPNGAGKQSPGRVNGTEKRHPGTQQRAKKSSPGKAGSNVAEKRSPGTVIPTGKRSPGKALIQNPEVGKSPPGKANRQLKTSPGRANVAGKRSAAKANVPFKRSPEKENVARTRSPGKAKLKALESKTQQAGKVSGKSPAKQSKPGKLMGGRVTKVKQSSQRQSTKVEEPSPSERGKVDKSPGKTTEASQRLSAKLLGKSDASKRKGTSPKPSPVKKPRLVHEPIKATSPVRIPGKNSQNSENSDQPKRVSPRLNKTAARITENGKTVIRPQDASTRRDMKVKVIALPALPSRTSPRFRKSQSRMAKMTAPVIQHVPTLDEDEGIIPDSPSPVAPRQVGRRNILQKSPRSKITSVPSMPTGQQEKRSSEITEEDGGLKPIIRDEEQLRRSPIKRKLTDQPPKWWILKPASESEPQDGKSADNPNIAKDQGLGIEGKKVKAVKPQAPKSIQPLPRRSPRKAEKQLTSLANLRAEKTDKRITNTQSQPAEIAEPVKQTANTKLPDPDSLGSTQSCMPQAHKEALLKESSTSKASEKMQNGRNPSNVPSRSASIGTSEKSISGKPLRQTRLGFSRQKFTATLPEVQSQQTEPELHKETKSGENASQIANLSINLVDKQQSESETPENNANGHACSLPQLSCSPEMTQVYFLSVFPIL